MRRLFHQSVPNNRWINIYVATTQGLDRWKKDMSCETILDEKGRIKGVIPQVPLYSYDFGGTKGVKDIVPEFLLFPKQYQKLFDDVFHHRYFHYMTDNMYENGYRDHTSILGAPYDFRFILDPTIQSSYFQQLRQVIEAGCQRLGERAVVVTHSLGGILFRIFLSACVSQDWINKHISKWVCISAPFGGSYNALYAATSGDHYIPSLRSTVQKQLQNHLGIIACFPNTLAYNKDEPLLVMEKGNITISEYDSLAKKGIMPFKLWCDMFRPSFDAHMAKQICVPTHLVCASTTNSTQGKGVADAWDAMPSRLEYVEGDGVVPLRSLLAIERVVDPRFLTETIIYDNRDHTSLLNDDGVLKIVRDNALISYKRI